MMEATTSILIALILPILTYVIYNLTFGWSKYWSSRGIPTVPGVLPIFGNTVSIFGLRYNLGTWSRRIYEESEDKSMIGFYNMKVPTLLVRDLDLIKTVLQTSFKAFPHNAHTLDPETDPLFAKDIFFVRGETWRTSRAIFSSIFTTKRLRNMSTAVAKVSEKLNDYLTMKMKGENSREFDVKLLFSRYTTEVAANSVFSIDGNSFKDDYSKTLLDGMKKTLDPSIVKALSNHVLFYLPILGKFVKPSFVPPSVEKLFRKIASDVEESKKCNNLSTNDVQGMMLDLINEKKISHEEGLVHAFAFFIESFETSSLTASFMAFELAKNSEIQENLRREIVTTMTKHENRITYESLQEMTYLEYAILETLRLYSPVGYMLKVCSEKHQLQGSDGLSVEVEPDTPILIPIMGLHMDPKIWQDPKKFDPERFASGNFDNERKYAYLPFGEGPRTCPGMRLAIQQIKAAFVIILRNYRLELSPKMMDPVRIDPKYFLTTALGGFWIRLRKL